MNLDFFGISQTQLETGRDETRLCEVSRRRFRCQDVVRILILPRYLPQNLPQQRERWGAWTHVRRRGEGGDQGLILITLSPKPAQVADEEGWKHKRRLRGEIFPPPISPSSPPAHPPTYFIYNANPREGVSSCFGKISKLAELQNSLICRLQRLPLLSQRAHWIRSKVAL